MSLMPVFVPTVILALAFVFMPACRTARERAVDRAVEQLVASGPRVGPAVVLLTDFLSRRHGLKRLDALKGNFNAETVKAHPARLYSVLVGNAPVIKVTPADIATLGNPVDELTARAVNCRTLGLPRDFEKTLEVFVSKSGYDLTHAVLALMWAIEGECLKRDRSTPLLLKMGAALVEFILSESARPIDPVIEAIALLYYTGNRAMVRPEWLDGLIRSQRQDGGWNGFSSDTEADPHATALALWALLEAQFPGRSEPWLQKHR